MCRDNGENVVRKHFSSIFNHTANILFSTILGMKDYGIFECLKANKLAVVKCVYVEEEEEEHDDVDD